MSSYIFSCSNPIFHLIAKSESFSSANLQLFYKAIRMLYYIFLIFVSNFLINFNTVFVLTINLLSKSFSQFYILIE